MRWFKRRRREPEPPFVCPHTEMYEALGVTDLCHKHGCPDDPKWRGDGCR
jgi:hypothetical protein